MSLKTLWDNAQGEIEGAVGKTSYATWFSSIEASEKSPDILVIETPDDFYKNWFVEHYQSLIEDIVQRRAGSPVQIEFAVVPHVLKKSAQVSIGPPRGSR